MATTTTTTVPLGYRAVFLIFDFLFPLGGIAGHLFAPKAILSGFTATPRLPPNVETQVLLDGMAGWFAGLAAVHLYLQYAAPKNRRAWALVVAMTAFQDVFQIFGFARAMHAEARLFDTHKWRNEDFSNLIGYTVITLIRLAFLAGTPSEHVPKQQRKQL